MAWSSTGTRVLVGKNTSISVAAHYEMVGVVCKVYATTTTTIEEVRGLTKEAALALVDANTSCNKTAFRTTHGLAWAVVPMLEGTEKHANARRSNEANGWTVTITTSETTGKANWSDYGNA